MHERWAPAIIVPPLVSRTRYTVIGSWSVGDHELPPSIDRKMPPLFSPSTTSPHAAKIAPALGEQSRSYTIRNGSPSSDDRHVASTPSRRATPWPSVPASSTPGSGSTTRNTR